MRRSSGNAAFDLSRTPHVDAVGVEERAAALAKRSIKKGAKQAGIRLAISMIDLTTLEGKDSPGKVEQMCRKAIRPLPGDPSVPSVAAVCVYPNLVAIARRALAGTPIHVASVATGFPAGQVPLEVKIADTRLAVELGADEIDMVIDRGAFLSGDYGKVFDEISAVREACGSAHLKVILETGELGTYDNVRRASDIAIAATGRPGDFIKTSTGKIQPAATPAVVLVMLEAIRDHYLASGVKIGMKPAGGVRTTKQALHMLVLVKETLGDAWLTPDLFRLGASTLTNDLLMQLAKEATGSYQSEDYFSKDERMQRLQPSGFHRVPLAQICDLDAGSGRRRGMICNISSLGAYIHIADPPAVETEVTLTFRLPDEGGLILAGSRVTWVNDKPAETVTALPVGCGVRFLSLAPDDEIRIAGLVQTFLSAPQGETQVGVRVPRSGKVRVPFIAACEFEGDEGKTAGIVCNLSTLGVYAALDRIPDLGERGRIRFAIPGRGQPFTSRVTVTWLNPEIERRMRALPPGCGLRFEGLNPFDQAVLSRLVDEYLAAPESAKPATEG